MKTLFYLFIFIPSFAFSQDRFNCGILTAILKNESARKTFKLDKNSNSAITVVDTKRYFAHCALDSLHQRSIKISSDTASIHENGFNIIIHKIVRTRKGYDAEVQQKITGAYGHIILRARGKDFEVSQFLVGYF